MKSTVNSKLLKQYIADSSHVLQGVMTGCGGSGSFAV